MRITTAADAVRPKWLTSYIGTGDGGSGCDPPNNAQRWASCWENCCASTSATLRRITPSRQVIRLWAPTGRYRKSGPTGCAIRGGSVFDRLTGDLWIGDVGQDSREEVDLQPAAAPEVRITVGGCMKGFSPTLAASPSACLNGPAHLDYDHSSNRCAIIGGYRYRGAKIAPLVGTYLYADECGGQIYGATTNGVGGWTSTLLTDTVFTITTFGQDDAVNSCIRYATNGAIIGMWAHDSVGDGIADWWRQQYFGAPITTNNASCATLRPRCDGFNNLQEYYAAQTDQCAQERCWS